ncbi:hypothetical protein [Leminorella grimontii]|uniref:hypothetical protein n=1 Tax=Leminorella grimontii TaxID=82981 RepID=UPI00208017CC|nr:hypothetical protein [Leminorella grimontii]GKX58331.1 hypothetical protein SOASR031_06460 [Leminorella grimontii]
MIHKGIEYSFTRGSDIIRDGMYLELNYKEENTLIQIAEVFFSDATFDFSLSCFQENVPLPLIEILIEKAKVLLPPKDHNL